MIFWLSIILSFIIGFVLAVFLLLVFTKPEQCQFKHQFSTHLTNSSVPSISLQNSNRASNAVNSLLQFLFQELKDTGQVRRYFIRKIKLELDELTKRKVLSSLLRNIEIRDFDMGRSSPEFNAISLRDCKYDSTGLLETVQIYTHIKYSFGFSLSIAVDTLIEKSGVFSFKLDKFESDAYFVLCREPFTHWYLSFSREPFIEMTVSTHVGARNIPQLANLIANQLKKAILKKHVWPAYKVRFKPFFISPPSVEIDDEITATPTGQPLFRIFLKCVPFEMLSAEIRCIDRLSNSYADILAKPNYKYHQQLVVSLLLSEASVYDEISTNKLYESFEKYSNLRRIKLPRALGDCFKLSEITVFRCSFVYVTKTTKSIERMLEVGDVLLQINNQRIITIDQFNSLYNDKLVEDSINVVIKKVKVIPSIISPRPNKGKDSADYSATDVEEAVRMALTNMDFWFTPDQLKRMHYSRPKIPGKFVNFDEIIALKLRNSDVFCNVLLLSFTESSSPTILAYTCFTLDEIVIDCDLTLKRECQFSRSLFPADFDLSTQGLGNAIYPQGFAHTIAHGNVVIVFRLIENVDALTFENVSSSDNKNNDLSIIKLNSPNNGSDDDVFIVHKLRPFRADTTQYCEICNGKIWMKNALRCSTCGVLCHQKCASSCYLTRCQGQCVSNIMSTNLDVLPQPVINDDEAQISKYVGFREARMMLADNDLFLQTIQIGHQIFLSLSDVESQALLRSKVEELSKNFIKEYRSYKYNNVSVGTRQSNTLMQPLMSQNKDKLKSLATLYLVHLHAMDELSTDVDIISSMLQKIVDQIDYNGVSTKYSLSSNKSIDVLNTPGNTKSKFMFNVGKLVNKHGPVVNAYSRYKDRMLSKVWTSSAPSQPTSSANPSKHSPSLDSHNENLMMSISRRVSNQKRKSSDDTNDN